MKKENIYLDLSKLSGEEIKEVISKLPEPLSEKDYHITRQHIYLMYHEDDDNWWVGSKFPYWHLEKRTEISLSEFRQLFSVENKPIKMTFGITDKNVEVINKQLYQFEGAEFDRLSWEKIAKEIGWDLPTIILWYFRKMKKSSKEVLQVENNGWIKIESEKDLPTNSINKRKLNIRYHAFNSKKEKIEWNPLTLTGLYSEYQQGNISHYQPIQKPEPPKF